MQNRGVKLSEVLKHFNISKANQDTLKTYEKTHNNC